MLAATVAMAGLLVGLGPMSVATAAPGVPGAPRSVTATAGDAKAVVSWQAPTSTGGSPLTQYTASCSSPGKPTRAVTVTPPTTTGTVVGLTNGASYTCRVVAKNANGTGPASAPSPAVVPLGSPTARRSVAATTQAGQLTVRWQPPSSTGGAAVSGYTVACTSTDGGPALNGVAPGSARSKVLTGLPDNRTYSCAVTARTAGGTSPTARTAYVMHAKLTAAVRAATMHVPVKAGDRLSALARNSTLPDCQADLTARNPDGSDLGYICVRTGGELNFMDGAGVTGAGTATVSLTARVGDVGVADLVAYVFADSTGTMAIGGPPVTVTIGVPGQNATRTFSGRAGQQVTLDVTGATAASATASLYAPDGSNLVGVGVSPGLDGFSHAVTLPSTGTYRVVVDPYQDAMGQVTLKLANVPANTGTIAINGPPVTVTIGVPGQNGTRTFAGRAGQQVTLDATGNTIDGGGAYLYAPDGAAIGGAGLTAGLTSSSGPVTLPSTGTYRVVVDPFFKAVGKVTLKLHT